MMMERKNFYDVFVFLQQKCSFISHVADAENVREEWKKKNCETSSLYEIIFLALTVSATVGAHSAGAFNRFMR